MIGRGELDSVTNRENLLLLAIHRDAHLAARVVSRFTSIYAQHREPIVLRVDAPDARVIAFRNAGLPRSARIAQNVVDLVLLSPRTICAGHLLTRHKRLDGVLFLAHDAARLQLRMNAPIDFRARQIVGRHYQRAFRRLDIFARDGRDALLVPFHFMHAALPVKAVNGRANLTARQLLDSLLQFRVFLSHNPFEPHRPHSGFL